MVEWDEFTSMNASDLGWSPGHWPDMFTFSGHSFHYEYPEFDDKGHLEMVHYRTDEEGFVGIMSIFND